MPSLKAIVFDLDDTLYPERSFVDSGFSAVARWVAEALGMEARQVLDDLTRLQAHGVRGNLFDVWREQHGHESLSVDDMVRVYREHKPSIRLYPGVSETLRLLKSDYRLGLLSDGYLDTQRNKFCGLALDGYFEALVFSDALGRSLWKPHPAPYLAVLQKLGVAPEDAIYVGDNPIKDFIGARRVGMHSIRVRYPSGVYADKIPATNLHEADAQLNDLCELPAMLTRLYCYGT